jgi:hypothetical protein
VVDQMESTRANGDQRHRHLGVWLHAPAGALNTGQGLVEDARRGSLPVSHSPAIHVPTDEKTEKYGGFSCSRRETKKWTVQGERRRNGASAGQLFKRVQPSQVERSILAFAFLNCGCSTAGTDLVNVSLVFCAFQEGQRALRRPDGRSEHSPHRRSSRTASTQHRGETHRDPEGAALDRRTVPAHRRRADPARSHPRRIATSHAHPLREPRPSFRANHAHPYGRELLRTRKGKILTASPDAFSLLS